MGMTAFTTSWPDEIVTRLDMLRIVRGCSRADVVRELVYSPLAQQEAAWHGPLWRLAALKPAGVWLADWVWTLIDGAGNSLITLEQLERAAGVNPDTAGKGEAA